MDDVDSRSVVVKAPIIFDSEIFDLVPVAVSDIGVDIFDVGVAVGIDAAVDLVVGIDAVVSIVTVADAIVAIVTVRVASAFETVVADTAVSS